MDIDVSVLLDKTLSRVERIDDEMIKFHVVGGDVYTMYHDQDCCEGVMIDDIWGDLNDLVGVPILVAEEATSGVAGGAGEDGYYDSQTWTFYKFATVKGWVDIRWYGTSNGYYSEGVSFKKG